MKCPRCWANKAYRHPIKGVKGLLLRLLLLVPMKCHHCYYKFAVFWLRTIGQATRPPSTRPSPAAPTGPSYAARHRSLQHRASHSDHPRPAVELRKRAA